MSRPPLRVCMVCLGNICRSPTAEAILRARLDEAGIGDRVSVESAGTGDWQVGRPPDRRAVEEGSRHGVELDGVARQFDAADFDRYDLVLAMDRANLQELRALAPDAAADKVGLLRDYDPAADPGSGVPDPYMGGRRGFAEAFTMIERAADGLVGELRERLA